MDILEIVNKGLGRMKRTFVPALISQQNFASLIRNISKTPICLNKQFRASANHYDRPALQSGLKFNDNLIKLLPRSVGIFLSPPHEINY